MTTFSMDDVSVVVNGKIISGFGDDVAVSIDMNNEQWQMIKGADGDTVRLDQKDETARITITLLQTSESNNFLEDLYTTDRLTKAGIVPVRVTDLNTGRKYTAPNAWLVNLAPVVRGRNHQVREWIFETDKLTVGSN